MSGSPSLLDAGQPTASNLRAGQPRAQPYALLSDGFRHLLQGNRSYEFVLLRESPLGPENIDGDDIDLLGTRESINSLIEYAFQLVKSGFFHIRIVNRIPDKTLLQLYSIDGKHVLTFDLWVNLWQIDRGKHKLRYVDCQPLFTNQTNAIRRLPVQLEACVYIHHIATKKKHINSERVQQRLHYYGAACRENGFNEIADIVYLIRKNNEITEETIRRTKKLIESEIGAPLPVRSTNSLIAGSLSRLKEWRLGSPRRVTLTAIMGCDGSGKTSLAKNLLANASNVDGVYKGKRLYRRSVLYNILLATVRPLLRLHRETFDEKIALIAYIQAAIKLRILVVWNLLIRRSGLTIVDRTLADFVYVERKTDQPRFCNGGFIAHFFGCRIPVAHLVVSNDVLMERKKEFTKSGQQIYDDDMFRFHARRVPTDYTVFYNSQSLSDSSAAMVHLMATANFGRRRTADRRHKQLLGSSALLQRVATPASAFSGRKMEVVDIGSMNDAFAWGANRICFVHPVHPDRCIKILRPDMSPEKKKNSKKFHKRLRHANRFNANEEEYDDLKKIEKYYDRNAWEYILKHYGFVKTVHGIGLSVELIRDQDGTISITLKQYILEFGKTQELSRALAAFEHGWQRLGLPSRKLDLLNILVQRQGDRIRRLVVVDGLGWPQFIPIAYVVKPIARREAALRLRMMHKAINDLLARMRARDGFSEIWLDIPSRQACA